MQQTREKAFAAFEIVLGRLEAVLHEPSAWTEHNLLEALIAITAQEYDHAVARIAAAQQPPTPAEFSATERHELLTRAEIRECFDDLRAERRPTWKSVRH